MTWFIDLPAHYFPVCSFFLFATGIFLLWMAQRQKKFLELDLRLALCMSVDDLGCAETKFLMSTLIPPNDLKLHPSAEDKQSLFSWISLGRKLLIRQIAQAGFTKSSAESLFCFCTILAGMTGGFLAVILEFGLSVFYVDIWAILFDIVFYAAVFSIFPFLVLGFLVRRRREELELHVPDLIDLLVLCVGTGLTLEASLRKTTKAMANLSPLLSSEMKTMLNDLRILPDKSTAFENLQNRTSSEGLKYLFMALYQSEAYGTSVTAALRSVAVDNRKRRMISLENTAARLPVLLSLPLIVFILPPVIAISAGPGFILMLRAIGN